MKDTINKEKMAPTRMILCDDSPSYFGSELKCNSILTMRGREVKVILSSPCLVQDGKIIDNVCTTSKMMHYVNLPFQIYQNTISSLESVRQAPDKISELILMTRSHEMKEMRKSCSEKEKKSTSPSYMLADEVVCDRPVIVLGMNISHLSRRSRFIMCAGFVYSFSLLYAFLQELLSIHLLNRKLGLFLAMWQMMICTAFSYIFRRFNVPKQPLPSSHASNVQAYQTKASLLTNCSCSSILCSSADSTAGNSGLSWRIYFWLSILRAVEIGMANLSMQYINYPAKTLMKSSRVIFTIFFGLVVLRRRYPIHDYIIAVLTVTGLALFLHADSTSSTIFQSMGVLMLSTSLMCDGAIVNLGESLMQKYNVAHDDYLFRLSSVAAVAITFAAACRGDLTEGARFLVMRGTYEEIELGVGGHSIWTFWRKILVLILFCTAGFLGSSCSAFITREYGALTMSITSTARKATTLFISFVLFKNVCTWEHALGIFIFMSSLILKTLISNGEFSISRWKGNNVSSLNNSHEVSCLL